MNVCCHVRRSKMLVLKDIFYMLLSSKFVKLIKNQFCKFFIIFFQDSEVMSAKIYRENLREFLLYLQTIKNFSLCLFCLYRDSEHHLSCSYTMCDICIQIYVNSDKENHWAFKLNKCIFCQENYFWFIYIKIWNPVQELRVFSFDDEDYHEIVFLKFLQILQNHFFY